MVRQVRDVDVAVERWLRHLLALLRHLELIHLDGGLQLFVVGLQLSHGLLHLLHLALVLRDDQGLSLELVVLHLHVVGVAVHPEGRARVRAIRVGGHGRRQAAWVTWAVEGPPVILRRRTWKLESHHLRRHRAIRVVRGLIVLRGHGGRGCDDLVGLLLVRVERWVPLHLLEVVRARRIIIGIS